MLLLDMSCLSVDRFNGSAHSNFCLLNCYLLITNLEFSFQMLCVPWRFWDRGAVAPDPFLQAHVPCWMHPSLAQVQHHMPTLPGFHPHRKTSTPLSRQSLCFMKWRHFFLQQGVHDLFGRLKPDMMVALLYRTIASISSIAYWDLLVAKMLSQMLSSPMRRPNLYHSSWRLGSVCLKDVLQFSWDVYSHGCMNGSPTSLGIHLSKMHVISMQNELV